MEWRHGEEFTKFITEMYSLTDGMADQPEDFYPEDMSGDEIEPGSEPGEVSGEEIESGSKLGEEIPGADSWC